MVVLSLFPSFPLPLLISVFFFFYFFPVQKSTNDFPVVVITKYIIRVLFIGHCAKTEVQKLNKPPTRHNESIYTPICGRARARLAPQKNSSLHYPLTAPHRRAPKQGASTMHTPHTSYYYYIIIIIILNIKHSEHKYLTHTLMQCTPTLALALSFLTLSLFFPKKFYYYYYYYYYYLYYYDLYSTI